MKRGPKKFGDSKAFGAEKSYAENVRIALAGNLPVEYEMILATRRWLLLCWSHGEPVGFPEGDQAVSKIEGILFAAILNGDGSELRKLADLVESHPGRHPLEVRILTWINDRLKPANWRTPNITAEELATRMEDGLDKRDASLEQFLSTLEKFPTEQKRYLEELGVLPSRRKINASYIRQVRRACRNIGVTLKDARSANRRRNS